jgi:hypothetical protein
MANPQILGLIQQSQIRKFLIGVPVRKLQIRKFLCFISTNRKFEIFLQKTGQLCLKTILKVAFLK